jgi:hypothetical protein
MKSFNPSDETSYTFSDYFKLTFEVDEILDYFGYGFKREYYQLKRSDAELTRLEDLKFRLEQNNLYTSINSEMARREFLIAPVLTELIVYTQSKIRVEYSLTINNKLKGILDYLLQNQQQLLVIEAKNADLEQGFKQLAVEMVALHQWQSEGELDAINTFLYGAVSVGNVWQFSILNTHTKQMTQDLNLFRVPADVDDLLRVMIAILEGKS